MYKKNHLHFVGINGIGMSGIAKILHKEGYTVSGCDLASDKSNVQELIESSCQISNQHGSTICNDPSISIVVYSSDIAYDNTELVAARKKKIPTVKRAVILAEIMRTKFSIGVAGSHGKTTTTSLIAHILIEADFDPTVIVGGVLNNINNNARHGVGKYAVVEADESDRSLLLLPVTLGIITNIDFEHTNIYENIDDVAETFKTYLEQLPFYGKAIISTDDINIAKILPHLSCQTITYGTTNQAQIQAVNIKLNADNSYFDIIDNKTNSLLGSIYIPMPSMYNVLNAIAAIATALEIDIPFRTIAKSLTTFKGIDRRFTYKGTMVTPTVEIFDDYGHHPTEIFNSLITAQRKTKNKLIVVFQPQRYTRTYHLWDEFVKVFATSEIDHLILTDIYPANEAPIENITTERLANEIQKLANHMKVQYISFDQNLEKIKEYIEDIIDDNDLVLLLGAGKINMLAEKLLQ